MSGGPLEQPIDEQHHFSPWSSRSAVQLKDQRSWRANREPGRGHKAGEGWAPAYAGPRRDLTGWFVFQPSQGDSLALGSRQEGVCSVDVVDADIIFSVGQGEGVEIDRGT